MSRILVLGGTGFIGRNMTEHFAALGHDVMATLHTGEGDNLPNVHRWWGDLREPVAVNSLIKGWLPDIIIHAAATTSGSRDIVNTPALHVTDNAVMGSYIFRAAAEAGVKHVIFFSCSVMYPDGHVNEETPPAPHPKYFGVAHTKLYLEKLCEFYSNLPGPEGTATKFTAIRHSNIYGPYDKFDLERSHLMGATIAKVMREEWPPTEEMTASEILRRWGKISVWGNGEEKRDLLYVSDLCDFVQLVVEKQDASFKLYNCGYGISFSVNDIVQRVIDASGKSLTIDHNLAAPTIPTSLSLDCTKAQRELGWNPNVTLPDGIRKTLDWYERHNCS